MIVLAIVYLYKFQVKPRLNKLGSILKGQHFSMALQPVAIKTGHPAFTVNK
jgi:hypothetical protein